MLESYQELIATVDIAGNYSITKRRKPRGFNDLEPTGSFSPDAPPVAIQDEPDQYKDTKNAHENPETNYLDIVTDLSQEKSKVYGERGLTAYGKKMLRRSIAVMERKYHKSRLGFVTFTLPEWSEKVMRFLSRDFREMVRQLEQQLRRELIKVGAPPDMAYCVEIQMKRFRDGKGIVPHIHMVILARSANAARADKPKWYIRIERYKEIWNNIVQAAYSRGVEQGFATEKERPNYMPVVRPEVVKKSAVGYVSKYMSKGGRDLQDMLEYMAKHPDRENPWELPRRWWGVNKALRAVAEAAVVDMPVWLYLLIKKFGPESQGDDNIRYKRAVRVFLEDYGFEKVVALIGVVRPKVVNSLFDVDKPKPVYEYPKPFTLADDGELARELKELYMTPQLC